MCKKVIVRVLVLSEQVLSSDMDLAGTIGAPWVCRRVGCLGRTVLGIGCCLGF